MLASSPEEESARCTCGWLLDVQDRWAVANDRSGKSLVLESFLWLSERPPELPQLGDFAQPAVRVRHRRSDGSREGADRSAPARLGCQAGPWVININGCPGPLIHHQREAAAERIRNARGFKRLEDSLEFDAQINHRRPEFLAWCGSISRRVQRGNACRRPSVGLASMSNRRARLIGCGGGKTEDGSEEASTGAWLRRNPGGIIAGKSEIRNPKSEIGMWPRMSRPIPLPAHCDRGRREGPLPQLLNIPTGAGKTAAVWLAALMVADRRQCR